jgi:hypothetical protein
MPLDPRQRFSMPDATQPAQEPIVAAFLERVGTGRSDDARAMLAAAPGS